MTLSLFIVAAAMPLATPHDARIDHHGGSTTVSYAAHADVATRTVGSSAPNRMDMRRCRWSADVVVERTPKGMPELARVVSRDHSISGSVPGACAKDMKAVHREIAAREGEVQRHLAAVAQQDGALLLAEINAARTLASN